MVIRKNLRGYNTFISICCLILTFCLAVTVFASERFYLGQSADGGPPDQLMSEVPTFPPSVIAYHSPIGNLPFFGYLAENMLQADITADYCQFLLPVYAQKKDFTSENSIPPVNSHDINVELILINNQNEVEIASASFTVTSNDHLPFIAKVPLSVNYLPNGSTLQVKMWTPTSFDDEDEIYMVRSRALIPHITFINYKNDINHDNSVDLVDLVIALQTITGSQPAASIFADADSNGDNRIGVVEAVKILQVSSNDRCSSKTPWYCHDQDACSSIDGIWSSSDSNCLYYNGGWSGTWQSSADSDTGNLHSMLYQTRDSISGDIQFTHFECNNNSPISITGNISDNKLNLISGSYTCPDGIGNVTLTDTVSSENELVGDYEITIDNALVDYGTFSLSRQ